jgi:WD40 repeat protein
MSPVAADVNPEQMSVCGGVSIAKIGPGNTCINVLLHKFPAITHMTSWQHGFAMPASLLLRSLRQHLPIFRAEVASGCCCAWQGMKRTSNLLAPIMQLVGHGGDVLTMRFSPDGQSVASGSFDRTILLWRTFDECENYMMMRGHKNAVTEVHWFADGERLLSCSADKTVRCWDAEAGVQIKRLTEHKGIVNSCCPLQRGPQLFVSGGDDSSVKVTTAAITVC